MATDDGTATPRSPPRKRGWKSAEKPRRQPRSIRHPCAEPPHGLLSNPSERVRAGGWLAELAHPRDVSGLLTCSSGLFICERQGLTCYTGRKRPGLKTPGAPTAREAPTARRV